MADCPDSPRDAVVPGPRWQFDGQVADCFDDMLARSIPDYHSMRDLVTRLASRFILPGTAVVDLGASRGTGVAPLVQRFGATVTWHLCEISPPMLDALRARFAGLPPQVLRIHPCDLRTDFPDCRASVILSILTLQFTPIEHRHRILHRIAEHLLPGGVLILVEKVLGSTFTTDTLLVEEYHRIKGEHGYTQDQIERKRLSLEGVLVPVTAAWNRDLLAAAGFAEAECFWRCLNFAGWIARMPQNAEAQRP